MEKPEIKQLIAIECQAESQIINCDEGDAQYSIYCSSEWPEDKSPKSPDDGTIYTVEGAGDTGVSASPSPGPDM